MTDFGVCLPFVIWRGSLANDVQAAIETRQMSFIHEIIHVLQLLQEVIEENDEWKIFCGQELCRMILYRYWAIDEADGLRTACDLADIWCTAYGKDSIRKIEALNIFVDCKSAEDD